MVSNHYQLWAPEHGTGTAQTVSFLINDYLLFAEPRVTASTLRDKKQRLGIYHRWLQANVALMPTIEHLTAHNFRVWMASLVARNLSRHTIRGYARNVKTWHKWLATEGHFDLDPLRNDRLPSAPKSRVQPFTDDETDRLLAAIDWRFPETARRRLAILVFLLDTGVRVGELVTLTDDHLDLAGQRAYVLGKGQKERWVYFGSQCRRVLHKYIAAYRPASLGMPTYVFRAPDGGPMSRDRVEQICRELGERAGVDRCHPHRFRHTFGYRFIREGGNVFSLQRLLGHAQVSTVMIYVEMQEEDLARDQKLFSPGDRLKLPKR